MELELGKKYKVITKSNFDTKSRNRRAEYQGKLIYINKYYVVFDTGKYRNTECVGTLGKEWKVG